MTHEEKPDLRVRLKSVRSRLSADQVQELSTEIAHRALQEVDWSKVKTLHVYTPLVRQREVDTRLLLETVASRNPSIRVAHLDHIEAFWANGDPVVSNEQFDVVVVPMLGFTDDCYRLGFGGGFYDRFLEAQTHALKIGLAYNLSLCSFKPEAHDVPMDIVVTEIRVFRRG